MKPLRPLVNAPLALPCELQMVLKDVETSVAGWLREEGAPEDALRKLWREDPHVSLSRPFELEADQLEQLGRQLAVEMADMAGEPAGCVSFGGLEVYTNDTESRSFLALRVAEGRDELARLVDRVDATLAQLGLPSYYADASFHISVFAVDQPWTLVDEARVGALSAAVAPRICGLRLPLRELRVSAGSRPPLFSVALGAR